MKVSSTPLMQEFSLESDPDGVAVVLVRQAREGENIERAKMFARTRYGQDSTDGAYAEQEINARLLRRKEAYLTLGRATGFLDENEKELFRSKETKEGPSVKAAMSEQDFNTAWDRLLPEAAAEIGRDIFEVNATWNPNPGE